jgi:hypothetical protein
MLLIQKGLSMFRRVLRLFNTPALCYFSAAVSMFLDEFLRITFSLVALKVVSVRIIVAVRFMTLVVFSVL